MKNHYFKTKMVKMGQWAHPPLDAETWHGQETNRYFQKHFGLPKGLLLLFTLDDGYGRPYAPKKYFPLLFKYIKRHTKKDYKFLEKKFEAFYGLDEEAKKIVSKIKVNNLGRASNLELATRSKKIRNWIHYLVIFDQFSWLAEEYWTPLMENILTKKMGLAKNSEIYNQTLFNLIKPEKISTTLSEKQAVIAEAIKIKQKLSTPKKSAGKLASAWGWMPVFTFGETWQAEHYLPELKETDRHDLKQLQAQLKNLKDYKKIRSQEIKNITKKYNLNKKDLQVFIDFGLALDTRNEAEYFVSYAHFYIMPILREAAKRLYVSLNQLRKLTEKEFIDALMGKIDVSKLLNKKGGFAGWGFDEKMKKRTDFSPKQAKKLFKFVESYVKPIQGHKEGAGLCASPGKAQGKARVVSYPSENYKVKSGDILITYSTTTDYLPAMKRAAAIVTEVGGLTCHAAVVSREFGIPCIVAVKNAMSYYKDNDIIEVDANKGIIKKL